MSLIQTLPNTPLDIIGDVHGQFEALQNLLHYLGYTPDGRHPQGRKIVFVGDLVDRGPDSPAVLQWFKEAHTAGNAFMVLGNHELNLLTGEAKDGSGWFFTHRYEHDSRNYAPWRKLPDCRHAEFLDLLARQPLVLQRGDLRIVHAAWLPDAIEKIRLQQQRNIVELYQEWDDELQCCIKHTPWYDQYLDEQRQYAHTLENHGNPPAMLPATAAHDVYRSSYHPIRALTCGIEKTTAEPFFAGGRWRFSVRNPWWNDYQDPIPVVIGHYWRCFHPHAVRAKHREGIFTVPAHHWHGARRNVFCIDFSVGARWRDRKRNICASQSQHRLGALRFPERVLVFDNGDTLPTEAA